MYSSPEQPLLFMTQLDSSRGYLWNRHYWVKRQWGQVLKTTLKPLLGNSPSWRPCKMEGMEKRGKEEDPVPSTTWCLFVKVWLSAWSADTRAAGDLSLSVTDLAVSSASPCSPPVGTELYLDLSPRACALPMTRSQFWNSQGIRRGLYQRRIGASWGF